MAIAGLHTQLNEQARPGATKQDKSHTQRTLAMP